MSEPYHRIVVGNRRTPLGTIILQGDKPVDIASATVEFYMNDSTGTAKVAASATGITKHPTYAFTADATNNRLVRNSHTVENGQQVVLASSGTLPAGLATATRYFVQGAQDNTFQVALTRQGTPVDITDTGSGAHTYFVVGSVQKAFLANDVDTPGVYSAWFTVEESSLKDTFPNTASGIRVEIVAAE